MVVLITGVVFAGLALALGGTPVESLICFLLGVIAAHLNAIKKGLKK